MTRRRPRPAPSLVEALSDALEAEMPRRADQQHHLTSCRATYWYDGKRPCGCSERCSEARALIERARADAVVQLELMEAV